GQNAVIILEYANMKNLQNLIQTNKDLPPSIIRVIMKQLLEGLRLIHEKGLIHRDIKGENILLHSPPNSGKVIVKIADFGLVKQQKREEQSITKSVAGTKTHMPPEMLIEDEEVDEEGNTIDMKIDNKIHVQQETIKTCSYN
ncbi:MAG: hypothetical protein EZS28_042185, partial [Streblomastix strix]